MFLVYINDITPEVQSSEARLFTDDSFLYIIVDDSANGTGALNEDLQRLTNWAENHCL